MSGIKSTRTSCGTCGQVAGIFTCRGCSESFCLRHTNEHRDVIDKQMNQIMQTHNQFKKTMVDQTTEQLCQSFLQQIERWEQQSMSKIRQVAKDVREHVLTTVRQRTDNFKEKLALLTQQLNRAKQDGEYFENDIRDWSERLHKLQEAFQEQQKMQICNEKSTTPFISKISISDMSDGAFTPSYSTMNYHKSLTNYSEEYSDVRESGEYSTGVRALRFKIEQYGPTSSVLFGIISKRGTEGSTPYDNPTLYGWGEKNLVYRGGDVQANHDGYRSDIQTDDILMLTIDCDRELITLKNERTFRSYVLEVDLNKCPFPWLPNVRFIST